MIVSSRYYPKDLTPLCVDLPFYDDHFVPGMVDESGRPIAAVFIHRIGVGERTVEGNEMTCLGGIRWDPLCGNAADSKAFITGLRLSSAMTQKAAALKRPFGGAKGEIFGHNIPGATVNPDGSHDWPEEIRHDLMAAFGQHIMPIARGWATSFDVGMKKRDFEILRRNSPQDALITGDRDTTDPSPTTAEGIMIGIEESIRAANRRVRIRDFSFAVKGVGNVGRLVTQKLWDAGAKKIWIADPREAVARAVHGGRRRIFIVAPEEIHKQPCDIYVPCAVGGSLNDHTISYMLASIIAGPENNQLEDPARHGELLHLLEKLYAPDYVINGGGLIQVLHDLLPNVDKAALLTMLRMNLRHIFEKSAAENKPTSVIADEMVASHVEQHLFSAK